MKLIIESLSQVTQLLGSHLSVATLMSNVGRSGKQGASLQALSEFLRSEGFENKLSKRPLSDIPLLTVPLVVILKNEEAAVITKIEDTDNGRFYTVQQVDGLSDRVTEEQLDEVYVGYCWFIKAKSKADVRSELPEYTLPKNWFFKVIWRFRRYYYQVALASILINFLALVSSLYVMNVYDRVIPNKNYDTLWVLSIGVIIAISFEFLTKIVRGKLTDIAGKKADLIISAALFRRVMGMKLQERPVSSGSYASNLRDFESVRDFMTSASLLTLVDLPFLLLFLFVIWMVGGYLVIVPATIIPIVIIMGFLVQGPMAKYINESMRESSQRQGLSVEAIDGVETLKTNNAYSWAQSRWEDYTAKSAASFLVLLGTFLIHSENPDNRITMGALIASVILSGRALGPLGQIAGLATRFQQAMLAFKGVNGIIQRKTERDSERKYVTFNDVKGAVAFENVAFHYNEENAPALKEFTLKIKPGEKVGVLGRVGSGKSTALKLAAGLYDANEGTVTLDDVDLRQIDPAYLRNQVLLLEQKPHLFLGTLRENMDLARMDSFSSNQDLIDALVRFGLQKMVQNHPRGLDMPIGEGGLGLSGGQKQLVALARMTLRDPRVVLLDEPTTGLDQGSETLALQSIGKWTANKTLIVVTHRPQVLQLVERLVVVDNGKVILDGPRDKVLAYLKENDKKK